MPLSHRLRTLQSELAALEVELADPSNPLLAREREEDNVDPGELIRGLVDVRGRLEKISKGKEGRGRLVNAVMGHGEMEPREEGKNERNRDQEIAKNADGKQDSGAPDVRSVVEMDRRVGELEKLVGSSSTALDEVRYPSPLTLSTLLKFKFRDYLDDPTPPAPSSAYHPSQYPTNSADATSPH